VVNCTFHGNSASSGGGMYNYDCSPSVTNCILWGNSRGQMDPWVTGSYCLVQGWSASFTHIISDDPQFVDADGSDDIVGTADDDLRLRLTSPAIDAGRNSYVPADTSDLDGDGDTGEPVPFDLAGKPRFMDIATMDNNARATPVVDMGAYETQPIYSSLHLHKLVTSTPALYPGSRITYTLSFTNYDETPAFGVIITDVVPPIVTGVAFAHSGPPITPTGSVSYTWLVADLAPGEGGTIAISGWISPGLANRLTFTNTAVITSSTPDPDLSDNEAHARAHVGLVFRVDDDAPDGGDGLAWATAFNDLQDALAIAETGDQIWVAAGTYKPTEGTDRDATFDIADGVAVYGGFRGNEAAREGRDWRANATILSGDIGAEGESSDNVYHVVTGRSQEPSPPPFTLDGFTITGGNAEDGCGGGIYIADGAPRVANCIIRGNHARVGGGICNSGYQAVFVNCMVIGNTATELGGGMFDSGYAFSGYTTAIVVNIIFSGNVAGKAGGGILCSDSHPILVNCTFAGNVGSAVAEIYGRPVLENCVLWGNSGGAISCSGHATVSYSLVEGGFYGTHNTDADPLFADADGPDDIPGTLDDDLRLLRGSPAIDAGDNGALPADSCDLDGDGNTAEPIPLDLVGSPRFADVPGVPDTGRGTPPIVDMGAYEAWAICKTSYLPLIMK